MGPVDPPADDPPADDPPADDPPADDPSADDPPADDPSADDPSAVENDDLLAGDLSDLATPDVLNESDVVNPTPLHTP